MLTVAYLCEFPTLLGGERSLLTFLSHARTQVEPLVVAPGEGDLAGHLKQVDIRRIDWPQGSRRRPEPLGEVLQRQRVQLIHANSLMTADSARTLGRLAGIPAVAHVRDMMTLSAARRGRLADLDALVAVSGAVADWLCGQGLARGSIHTIYNAVDGAALRRAAVSGVWRRRLGVDASQPLIACVGQLALRKGQDVFLEAAATLAHRFRSAHFVVAGARHSEKQETRAFEQHLLQRAGASPLAGRTHLVGYVEDVPSLLADVDVLVVPSRQEPLSRTLLEGLALGVPCVATAVGGTPEIIGTPPIALSVAVDAPEAMAAAVARLLEETSLTDRFRRDSPAAIESRFSVTGHVDVVMKLYSRYRLR